MAKYSKQDKLLQKCVKCYHLDGPSWVLAMHCGLHETWKLSGDCETCKAQR